MIILISLEKLKFTERKKTNQYNFSKKKEEITNFKLWSLLMSVYCILMFVYLKDGSSNKYKIQTRKNVDKYRYLYIFSKSNSRYEARRVGNTPGKKKLVRVWARFPKFMTRICDFPTLFINDQTKNSIPYLWPLRQTQFWRAFVDGLIDNDEKIVLSKRNT